MEKSWAGTGLFRVDASMKLHEHPASVVGDLLSAFEPAMVEIASVSETSSGSFLWVFSLGLNRGQATAHVYFSVSFDRTALYLARFEGAKRNGGFLDLPMESGHSPAYSLALEILGFAALSVEIGRLPSSGRD